MKTIAALAIAVVALVPVPAEARPSREDINVHVAVPDVSTQSRAAGLTCGLVAVTDLTGEPDVHVGVLFGGPLAPTSPLLATVSVKCSVQVGAAASTHAGADNASASSLLPLPGANAAAGLVQYVIDEGQPLFVCTQVTVNGQDFYWNAATLSWSTSSAVPCKEAIRQQLYPLVAEPLFPALDAVSAIVDPIVCPIIEGPLSALNNLILSSLWDCPPYED